MTATEKYIAYLESTIASLREANVAWKETVMALQAQVRELGAEPETRARRLERLAQEALARKG